MSDTPDEEQWGPDYEERTCWHCDAIGHGYVIGWEDVPGKGTQPILSSPCSYLEPYYWDPEDDDRF